MGAATPDRVHYDAKNERTSCDNLRSPPTLRNIYSETNETDKVEFFWYRKMMSLPRVGQEIQRVYNQYDRAKNSLAFVGAALSITEWFLLKFWTVTMVILFLQPIADITYNLMSKVKFWDDFVCHQLDFMESKLKTIDTRIIYRPGGILDRILLVAQLFVRITFFFPRIAWRMIVACVSEFKQDVLGSINIALKICMPDLPRRSRRRPRKSHKSPSRKRKHDEHEVTENLPEYFLSVSNYSEEADPDYQPNSDDTEVTSASENSHDESDSEGLEEPMVSESPQKKLVEINENVVDFPDPITILS